VLKEFILAEAGTGLGLQQDNDKNDPLWHGAGALQKNCGLGMQLCKHFCASTDESPCLVVNDLTKHDTFKEQCLVKEGPKLRFLACVPLRSPLYKMIVGTYIVVDDKPHEGLSDDELMFLKDLGITCMDHLGKLCSLLKILCIIS
jgi:GAF domain-containing protein